MQGSSVSLHPHYQWLQVTFRQPHVKPKRIEQRLDPRLWRHPTLTRRQRLKARQQLPMLP
ncbi:hypothetical protein [Archangium minus]|uniref:hypothetical protein n=1 Tax=Archangium minus TaxID=83450 RepID=UPI0037BE9922